MIYIKQVQPTIKLPGLSSFTVKFDYDKRLVDVIHQVPNAIWHKQLGVWEIPLTSLSRAVNLLSNYEEINLELLENVKEDISYLNNKKSKGGYYFFGLVKKAQIEKYVKLLKYGPWQAMISYNTRLFEFFWSAPCQNQPKNWMSLICLRILSLP